MAGMAAAAEVGAAAVEARRVAAAETVAALAGSGRGRCDAAPQCLSTPGSRAGAWAVASRTALTWEVAARAMVVWVAVAWAVALRPGRHAAAHGAAWVRKAV